jgi:CRP-like cAMP-binding protein
MKTLSLKEIPALSLDDLLGGISFFRELRQVDSRQTEFLATYARVLSADPGEIVIHHGDNDPSFYFLLRGQLLVYPDDDSIKGEPLSVITPGHVFGALAMICRADRTATLVADPNGGEVKLVAIDGSAFGELNDYTRVRRHTKILFYRMVVANTRWKLEVYRMQQPNHVISRDMRKLELFRGIQGSEDELQSLARQAQQMTVLLMRWNNLFYDEGTDSGASPINTD